jgi:anti-sigma factor RsiW
MTEFSCVRIDPLVTPFIDGELSVSDRDAVEGHLRVCARCASRVAAERAVRHLIQRCKPSLAARAPDSLRQACTKLARANARAAPPRVFSPPRPAASWRTRLTPLALAASLVLLVGAAFLVQITESSARVMAAELTADHVKCFAMNSVLSTHHNPSAVEESMLDGFSWQMHLPDHPERMDLELVGARPCLYGEGKVAHIMYTHRGRPVSLFMLPNASRSRELVKVLGHEAAIWCVGRRTFVLLAREPRPDVERIASFVQAGLQ